MLFRSPPPPKKSARRTRRPLREQQPDLIAPRQEVDEQHADEVRDEPDRADDRARIRHARRDGDADPDRHDLDHAVDAPEQRRLQRREPERGHDALPLVRERVRDVVDRAEEREQPRLRVQQRLAEPVRCDGFGEGCGRGEGGKGLLLRLEVLVLDTSLVFLCEVRDLEI